MRTNDRQHHASRGTIGVALGFSALLHVPLLIILAALQPDDTTLQETNFDAERAFSIEVVTEEEDEKQPEKPKPEDDLQYVSLDKPEQEETPDEARFADKFESKVEEETVKKALPGSPARSSPPPSSIVPPPIPEPPAPTESESNEQAEEQQAETELEDGVVAKQEAQSGSPSPLAPTELFPGLTNEQAAEMLGDNGTDDYLRDVAEGDKTLLNRKRTRYWAFFDRVKRQVLKQWSPISEYRKRDPYGNVYGVKDRYTTVNVTLNGDGTVRRLYVSRDSGLDFYDDEAIRALKTAGPFHNPPEGLKDEDGLLHFTFGFYFEISTGSFRFMRLGN